MRKFTCLKTISVWGLSIYFLIMDLGAGGLGGVLLRQTPYSSEWFSCGLRYLPHTQGNHAETESQSGTIGLSIPLVGCPHERTVQRQRNLLDQHKHEPAGQDLSGEKVLTLDHRFRWTTPRYLAAKQFNSLQRPHMDCIAVICHGHLVTVAFAEGHIIKGSDFTCEHSLYALDYLTRAGLDLTDPISCLHSIGQLFEGM